MTEKTSDQLTHITAGLVTATVSDLGAELQSLTYQGQEVLWHGDPNWWSGRSPILFPIVGKAPDDRVTINGHGGEMKQHGFARRMVFDPVEASADRVVHRLFDTPATRQAYPRNFALTVTHVVTETGLSVSADVTNPGGDPLPFGLGFHPAFLWPLPGGEGQAHRITLANGAVPELARLDNGLLPPDRHPSPFERGALTLDPTLFDADAMIFPQGAGEALSYAAEGGPTLTFAFEGLPNLALWQKPGAPFICIEPWHGMAAKHGAGSEMADRPGTITLPPGDTAQFRWSVTFD